jgi:glycosyltransferase involved in cell wall biosynthesis
VPPLVSVIIRSYNRAALVQRAVMNVLGQTFREIEVIVVDDGSTDKTVAVISAIGDPRVRIVSHNENRGANVALNTGLDEVRTDWFMVFDSDDEIMPNALDIMMSVPLRVDPLVTVVIANCIDSTTGAFAGKGLTEDGIVDPVRYMKDCRGEFIGLNKMSILKGQRLQEGLRFGNEGVLWDKMIMRARIYYINKALRIYHTGDPGSVSKAEPDFNRLVSTFRAIAADKEYWDIQREFRPAKFRKECIEGALIVAAGGFRKDALEYRDLLKDSDRPMIEKIAIAFIIRLPAWLVRIFFSMFRALYRFNRNLRQSM